MKLPRNLNRRAAPVIPDLFEEDISVDLFAGGGGASIGTESALNKPVTIAINHDPVAIAVHQDNHPSTEHYTCDIFEVDPETACRGRRVRHLHASPDCRHHSRAKGGKPVSESVRSLADVVVVWAAKVTPAVITLENVPEFAEWGPLDRKGIPIKKRRGEEFARWKGELEALGYEVQWRILHAHHFGAPTSRKRLFLVARNDGEEIRWPSPTHGPGLKPYRTAAECIDWSLPCPSIFLTPEEVKAQGLDVKRPLADATLRRVATGFVREVLEKIEAGEKPYVVTLRNHVAPRGTGEPLTTVSAQGTHHALVNPSIVKVNHHGERAPESIHKPLTTVTSARRGHAVVSPLIATIDNASSPGTPQSAGKPLSTIVATNPRHAVVAPTLVQTSYGERKGQRPRSLDLHKPLGTIVAGGVKHAAVTHLLAPFIAKHYGGVVGHGVERPIGTITAVDHHSVVSVQLAPEGFAEQYPNARKVLPFLIAYYSSGSGETGHPLDIPLPTITTADRFALVTLEIDGTTYAVVDIGLRMLEPHELLRAQFGEFAEGYSLAKAKTKKDQVRLVGNSVVPHMQRAVVMANLVPLPSPRATPRRRAA